MRRNGSRPETPPAREAPDRRPGRRPGPDDPALRRTREILERIFGPAGERPFAVRFWDGSVDGPATGAGRVGSAFTLVLRHPAALRRMFVPPTERRMGEAFLADDYDIEGPMREAVCLLPPLERAFRDPRKLLRLLPRLLRLPRRGRNTAGMRKDPRWGAWVRHSTERDARAVRFHYDVGNEFYRLWLDRRMVYSCGYFPSWDSDLDHAQEAKLDLVCRKLRLERGERFLDIGCGWGSLVVHAAAHYGVHARGITLSERQAEAARARIREEGLEDRCRIEVRDYRELSEPAAYDKIASVGMVEHVGLPRLHRYFEVAFALLRPGGLFLNHGIVTLERPMPALRRRAKRLPRRWTSFVDRYVFPDGELVAISDMLAPAQAVGFEVRDVENLREHYRHTLERWLDRLEERREEAVEEVGEPTFRVWRVYMAVAAYQFATARIAVMQSLLARPDAEGGVDVPPTREDFLGPLQHSR